MIAQTSQKSTFQAGEREIVIVKYVTVFRPLTNLTFEIRILKFHIASHHLPLELPPIIC